MWVDKDITKLSKSWLSERFFLGPSVDFDIFRV